MNKGLNKTREIELQSEQNTIINHLIQQYSASIEILEQLIPQYADSITILTPLIRKYAKTIEILHRLNAYNTEKNENIIGVGPYIELIDNFGKML